MCVCVCARARVCVCVCVILHHNSKRNRSRQMKLEYIVVHEITRESTILGNVGPRSRLRSDFETYIEPILSMHVCLSDTKG